MQTGNRLPLVIKSMVQIFTLSASHAATGMELGIQVGQQERSNIGDSPGVQTGMGFVRARDSTQYFAASSPQVMPTGGRMVPVLRLGRVGSGWRLGLGGMQDGQQVVEFTVGASPMAQGEIMFPESILAVAQAVAASRVQPPKMGGRLPLGWLGWVGIPPGGSETPGGNVNPGGNVKSGGNVNPGNEKPA